MKHWKRNTNEQFVTLKSTSKVEPTATASGIVTTETLMSPEPGACKTTIKQCKFWKIKTTVHNAQANTRSSTGITLVLFWKIRTPSNDGVQSSIGFKWYRYQVSIDTWVSRRDTAEWACSASSRQPFTFGSRRTRIVHRVASETRVAPPRGAVYIGSATRNQKWFNQDCIRQLPV